MDAAGRELLILLSALAFGLLAIPPLLWFVGHRTLGPYADGGVEALAQNYFRGLASGTLAFWVAALAPYLVVLLLRALYVFARGPLAARREAAQDARGSRDSSEAELELGARRPGRGPR